MEFKNHKGLLFFTIKKFNHEIELLFFIHIVVHVVHVKPCSNIFLHYIYYEKNRSFKELAMFLPLREGISNPSVMMSNSLIFSLTILLSVSDHTILKPFLENSTNFSREVSDNFVKSIAETCRLKILFKTTSRDMKLFTSTSVGFDLSVLHSLYLIEKN